MENVYITKVILEEVRNLTYAEIPLSTKEKKNLIITANGENISPEEIENKIGEHRLVQEILVRDSEGVIEAEIFPDYEYANKKKIKDMQSTLQGIIDDYNKTATPYKRVFKLKIRDVEFEKNTTKKAATMAACTSISIRKYCHGDCL